MAKHKIVPDLARTDEYYPKQVETYKNIQQLTKHSKIRWQLQENVPKHTKTITLRTTTTRNTTHQTTHSQIRWQLQENVPKHTKTMTLRKQITRNTTKCHCNTENARLRCAVATIASIPV